MSKIDLQTKKLTDIRNDCELAVAEINTVLDQLRVSLPDLSKKIMIDNCGTTSNKEAYFNPVIENISALSNVVDLCENLTEAMNNLIK